MTAWDAVVVGAGPAGSAAATLLARSGLKTLVLEKDAFPRRKVCGAFLAGGALASLDRLGALAPLRVLTPERIERGSVRFCSGTSVDFTLPAPALGVSRFALDNLLARGAAAAGATIRFGSRVAGIEQGSEGFTVALAGGESVRALAAIGAWGRWDALDRSLDRAFLGRGRRWVGWSAEYGADASVLAGEVRLYVFRGGYCGLSRVEKGRVNLAGVVSDRVRRRAGGGWDAVVAMARADNADLDKDLSRCEQGSDGFFGTGPVVFTGKPPAERGILMAGDAAGVLDPFSGEGQATALASGLLAGEITARCLSGGLPREDLGAAYAEAWRARFARPFAWNAVFRRLMLHPSLGALGARLAGEKLARFALARIYSPLAPSGVKIASSSFPGR